MGRSFESQGRRFRPRDRVIDEAKIVVMERFFKDDVKEVYYGRQIEVALENESEFARPWRARRLG